MKASETTILSLINKSQQFVVPIYQRSYSWSEKECCQLWNDIIRCGMNDSLSMHFIGSIVYIESGLSQVTHHAPLLLIDGQQRITTVTLLLAALADTIGDIELVDGFSKRKLLYYYLLNKEEDGERHFKLLLSQTDKETLNALLSKNPQPETRSKRIIDNYHAFQKWLREDKVDLSIVWKGLTKLVVIDIALNRQQDNPQLIFESMNSTGKALSQADLIRNYVLMGLSTTLQTQIYEQFWRPMELEFGQEKYSIHFDDFMRYYLTLKTHIIPNVNDVYDAFKIYVISSSNKFTDKESHIKYIVSDLREFARYFCYMAFEKEADKELGRAFDDLRELKVDVAYPFLLELYHDYVSGILSKEELIKVVRWIEAYVFRRAVCSIPSNSMNKTFATFSKAIDKNRYLESIAAHFLFLSSYRRFPLNDEFERKIQIRDLYNFRQRSYWLRRLENHGRKEKVPVEEYTIEHILPQNENLSIAWKESLGSDWKKLQQEWKHTLGNLTLTGYNSEYSDRSFDEKRDMVGGFKYSPLKVNQYLSDVQVWNKESINQRAKRLALQAIEVWEAP